MILPDDTDLDILPALPPEQLNRFSIPLTCAHSGLFLGKFFPSSGLAQGTSGSPYVRSWKDNTFYHPVFSLTFSNLFHKATSSWQLEKTGTRPFPMQHKQLLFLAMLHSTGCIKQTSACLPPAKIVEIHFPRVVELLSWKHEIASERIQFPRLHIGENTVDPFSTVGTWITCCEVVKEEYEKVARTRQKEAKKRAAELALKSIKRQMYADISLRRLWNWVTTQVPSMKMEGNEDLEQLFFTEETRISVWTEEDIEALEELFLGYCELGNSISYEVGKRIAQIRNWLNIHNDAFTIVVDDEKFADQKGAPIPVESAFANRTAYLVATARHKLANRPAETTPTPSKKASKKITSEEL